MVTSGSVYRQFQSLRPCSVLNIDRGLLVKEWCKGNRGRRFSALMPEPTLVGAMTDRQPELVHTLDTLDIDIALATLPMDFNIYDIPRWRFPSRKEIIAKAESPFKEVVRCPAQTRAGIWIIPVPLFSRLFAVQRKRSPFPGTAEPLHQ